MARKNLPSHPSRHPLYVPGLLNSSQVASLDWSKIINTPTTRDGYGITDVYTDAEADALFLTEAEADALYAALVHTHAAGDVTSGTFADARIAQSNVTQHQAALSIGWGQLTSVPTTLAGYGVDDDVAALIAAIELDDLADVVITTPADGDFLQYDSGTGHWVNVAVAPGGGTIDGSGTGGKITKWSDSDTLTDSIMAETTGLITVAGDVQVESNLPHYILKELDAATDEQYWDIAASAGKLFFRAVNDAYTVASDFMTVTRNAEVVDTIAFLTGGATRVSIDGGTGWATFAETAWFNDGIHLFDPSDTSALISFEPDTQSGTNPHWQIGVADSTDGSGGISFIAQNSGNVALRVIDGALYVGQEGGFSGGYIELAGTDNALEGGQVTFRGGGGSGTPYRDWNFDSWTGLLRLHTGGSTVHTWSTTSFVAYTGAIGDVGHGATWGGFANSAKFNTTDYALLQNDGSGGNFTLINVASGGQIEFRIANVTKWKITSGTDFVAETDNASDIGTSGANRPRTGYFGTSVVVPTLNATTKVQVNGVDRINTTQPTHTASTTTVNRAATTNTTTLANLAQMVGTLRNDLRSIGILA